MSFFKWVAGVFGRDDEGVESASGEGVVAESAESPEGELDAVLTAGLSAWGAIASDAERSAAVAAHFEESSFRGALEALSQRDPGRAVMLLRRYEAAYPEHPSVLLWLGRLYDARRDDEAARAVFTRLAGRDAYAAEANEVLGRIAERQGAPGQAVIFYQRALLAEWGRPGMVDACARLGAHVLEVAPPPLVIVAHEAPPGFEIEHPLGRGGFGTVYLGRDVALARPVALKFLHPFLRRTPERVESFFRETRIVASLDDPGAVRVYDMDPERHLIVMEYVDDGTLADRLASGRGLHPEAALACIRQLCITLTLVHERGLVHRDIKPANILFRRGGDAVLGDFGIASLEDGEQVSAATRQYAPPELMSDGRADRRADVYGLGVVLGAMLTGEPPPEDLSQRAAWLERASGVFEPDDLSEGVGRWLAALTARSPHERVGSASDVRAMCGVLGEALRGDAAAQVAVRAWRVSGA